MNMLLLLLVTQTTVKKVIEVASADKVVLQYLQVFTTLPIVTLVIFLVTVSLFKKEIRKLINDLESAKGLGVEYYRRKLADATADAILQPEQIEVDALPSGEVKEAKLKQLAEKKKIVKNQVMEAYSTNINSQLNPIVREHFNKIAAIVGQVASSAIDEHIRDTDTKVLRLKNGDETRLFIGKSSELTHKIIGMYPELREYPEGLIKRSILVVAMERAPLTEVEEWPSDLGQ